MNRFLLAGLAASTATGAWAEMQAAVPEIVVTGARETNSATKTPTRLIDTPQAVSVLGRAVIEQQGQPSVGELLRHVPGVAVAQGEGHRDQIVIRGNASTADFFVGGLRDDVQYYRGSYNLERLEVLKGPNAMMFGRGGGGGVVNRVEKRPFDRRQLVLAGTVDGYGAWTVAADANLPISDTTAARVNAEVADFASHRDSYAGKRRAINPTFAVGRRGQARVEVGYEHIDDRRVVDRGIPSRAGLPAEGLRDVFFGNLAGNQTRFMADVFRLDAYAPVATGLTIDGKLIAGDYDKYYANILPASSVAADGTVALSAYDAGTKRRNRFGQVNLVWRGDTGRLTHTLLLGGEVGQQKTETAQATGFFGNAAIPANQTIRINAAAGGAPQVWYLKGAGVLGYRSTQSEADILSLYVQDQIRIGRAVELIAGLRYDAFDLTATNRLTGQTLQRTDRLWSPRAGLVLHARRNVSVYASYSVSWLPQSGDQFGSLDLTTAALAPEKFENLEAGIKWQPRPDLMVTMAAFQLDRTNTRQPGVTPGTSVLTGAQRSRGIEVEASGHITPQLSVTGGLAWTDASIRRTTSAAVAGTQVPITPRFQATAWARYDIARSVGVGIGVRHESSRFTSLSNAVRLPGYTRLDGGLFVEVTPQIDLQLNVENLLGASYFLTAHNDNNIQPGAPRNARLTLRSRF